MMGMATPPAISADTNLARWAKRTLTYGASILAVGVAALYFLFQSANQAALGPFGLDASAFIGSPVEVIGGGLKALFVFSVLVFILYWPIGWPVGWISGKLSAKYIARFGEPARLVSLRSWVTSDPVKQRSRAVLVGSIAIIPMLGMVLHTSGSSIGKWRLSQASWLVSANGCANGCFEYKQEGRTNVIGRPIAANSSRMAIFVGQGRVETVDVGKLQAVAVYKGKPVVIPSEAPRKIRWGWWALDVLNANW